MSGTSDLSLRSLFIYFLLFFICGLYPFLLRLWFSSRNKTRPQISHSTKRRMQWSAQLILVGLSKISYQTNDNWPDALQKLPFSYIEDNQSICNTPKLFQCIKSVKILPLAARQGRSLITRYHRILGDLLPTCKLEGRDLPSTSNGVNLPPERLLSVPLRLLHRFIIIIIFIYFVIVIFFYIFINLCFF